MDKELAEAVWTLPECIHYWLFVAKFHGNPNLSLPTQLHFSFLYKVKIIAVLFSTAAL
jgi:hypothetical protein